jgi:CHRD domain-containing protein
MQKHSLTLATALAGLGFVVACGGSKSTAPNTITYTADLRPANEVLANGSSAGIVSSGSGTWTGTLNPSTNILTWTMSFTGLTSNSNASHIHAQAPTTTTANVVLNFATYAGSTIQLGGQSGTASGSVNLASATVGTGLSISGDSLRKAIDAGQAYVNVHSTQYPAGEIRGQIVKH